MADSPHVLPFRGLGTWVDIYDSSTLSDPAAAVAQMRADGARTLFLETSNGRAAAPIVDPATVSRFIVAAHDAGMRVVGWYLPSLGRPARDRARSLAALAFSTPAGERFDGFALDIESTTVRDPALRTQRAVDLMTAIRTAAGSRYPLGAIIPAPEGMRLQPGYWPGFPFRPLRRLVDAFLPMDYFTYHETTAAGAHAFTVANVDLLRRATGDPSVPIHLVGGEAGDATAEQVTAFAQAEREEGVLGGGLYDFATTAPAAWPELARMPANPPQRPPLPVALPDPSPLGNIPGGDRSHPKEIFYRAPPLSGAWAIRYRGFDLRDGEVQLWVNWRYVRTLRGSVAGGWSPWRRPVIPDGMLRPDGANVVQFVAAGDYPAWSVWGVRGASLVRPAASRPRPASERPWTAVVDVSVATLWAHPEALRPVDRPSATNPVDIPRWLAAMTTADRRWLVGRVQTQALYGTPVTVLGQRGRWSFVAAHGQATPLDPRGYPGWVPTRQLTGNTSLLRLRRTRPVAVVRTATAWLRDPATLVRRIQVSFGTRLTVVGRSHGNDIVATPNGGRLAIRSVRVAEYTSVSAIPTPAGGRIVRVARRFLGLAYLWGGTSGFGFDCSGFTYSVFRRFGVALPRDADRQAVHGRPVARKNLRPGDLVFFAGPGGAGPIHHVAIFIGSGKVIEAPRTGAVVTIAPLSALAGEYAGARRYL